MSQSELSQVPRKPTEAQLAKLRTYHIDCNAGKVYDHTGREVGWVEGYHRINAAGRRFRRSHVVWWAAHGQWPEREVDHRDRNKTNDSVSNLRLVTSWQNTSNSDRYCRDLPVGVSYAPHMCRSRPYRAQACSKFLGFYTTPDEAHQAYLSYRETV